MHFFRWLPNTPKSVRPTIKTVVFFVFVFCKYLAGFKRSVEAETCAVPLAAARRQQQKKKKPSENAMKQELLPLLHCQPCIYSLYFILFFTILLAPRRSWGWQGRRRWMTVFWRGEQTPSAFEWSGLWPVAALLFLLTPDIAADSGVARLKVQEVHRESVHAREAPLCVAACRSCRRWKWPGEVRRRIL